MKKHSIIAIFLLLTLSALAEKATGQTAEAYSQTISRCNAVRDFDCVLQTATKAIAQFPNEAGFYFYRAKAHSSLGKNEAAIADFTRTIEISPAYFGALFARGLIYEKLENWAAAEKDYSKAIELGNDSLAGASDLYTHRGIVEFDLSVINSDQTKRDAAIADFRKAVELAPADAQAKENLEVAISKGPVSPPKNSAPSQTESTFRPFALGFYKMDNDRYDKIMPGAEKLFKKLTTHRYPAPKKVTFMGLTEIVDAFRRDKNELAGKINDALQSMRAILDNNDILKELTAEQRQICQDKMDRVVNMQKEAARLKLVTLVEVK